jgi:hypothetical protein
LIRHPVSGISFGVQRTFRCAGAAHQPAGGFAAALSRQPGEMRQHPAPLEPHIESRFARTSMYSRSRKRPALSRRAQLVTDY